MMSAHPFLTTAIACFFCTIITGAEISSIGALCSAVVMCLCCIGFSAYASLDLPDKSFRSLFFTMSGISVFLSLMFGIMLTTSNKPGIVVLNMGVPLVISAAVYFLALKKLNTRKLIILIFIAAFIIRLSYIMSISISTKQHDAGSLEEMDGHLGYIGYLVFNGKLPDIDVRTVYQYYHPPLHHIIAALWVKFQNFIGISNKNVWENIQVLTMFYSCCCMIISYKIFRQLKLKGKGLAAAFAIVAFCPTFYILSGSINNDILCLTLSLSAILNTLYWYNSRSFGRIVCISACVGFAMMAKLSGWMVAPAIAFIFLYVFFKNLKDWKKYLVQFVSFIVVCAPLALWWGIRNYITHKVPITYIMELSPRSGQYVGDIPLIKRLLDFNPSLFNDVGTQFQQYEGGYNEYNPLVGLFKTSMFDETFIVSYYPETAGINKILFWSAVVLGLIGFAAMIYTFIADKKMSAVHKIFMGLFYGVYLVSYYIFCIKFPQVCTENIRYAVPLIVIGAFFAGWLLKNISEKNSAKFTVLKTCITAFIISVTSIYSLFSFLVYDIVFINK